MGRIREGLSIPKPIPNLSVLTADDRPRLTIGTTVFEAGPRLLLLAAGFCAAVQVLHPLASFCRETPEKGRQYWLIR